MGTFKRCKLCSQVLFSILYVLTGKSVFDFLNIQHHFTEHMRHLWTWLLFPPALSGVGRLRLHNDQVRSRDTANRSCASGEKAIWVTVSVWYCSLCNWRHVLVLHSSTAACSALDAWNDSTDRFILGPNHSKVCFDYGYTLIYP